MNIDMSLFPEVGKFIIDTAVNIYKSLNFNFGEFTLNGWWFILGFAITCVICWLVGRILD